jgi:serine/threonine protein kinase
LPRWRLLQAALDTGVLSHDEFDHWRDLAARHDADGAWLMQRMVAEAAITAYQAHALSEGHLARLRWGEYVVLEPLNRGSRGEAYRARDAASGRSAVLKLLPAGAKAGGAVHARLTADIAELKRLAHPRIAAIFGIGDGWGQPFVASEQVEGQSFAEVLRQRGALPWREAARYALMAAEALATAQARGLMHGEVKPAHLLITPADELKLLDFGLFRAREAEWTGPAAPGNIDFTAPEMAFARSEVNERADVYSLACVLYFLLTGQSPFAGGPAAQRLLRHRDETPPRLRTVCPTAPRWLDQLLAAMLAKNPAQRIGMNTVCESLKQSLSRPRSLFTRLFRRRLTSDL